MQELCGSFTKNNIFHGYCDNILYINENQYQRLLKYNVYLMAIRFFFKKSSLYNYLLHSILEFLFMYVSIKKYQTRDGLVLLTFVLYYYYGKIINSRLSDLTFTFSQS